MADFAMPILQAETATGGAADNNLVVAVSGSSRSEARVRAAKQLADSLGASFEAVHVETPGVDRDSGRGQRVADALALAAKLGATIVTLPAATVSDGIEAHLSGSSVQHLMIGVPHRRSTRFFAKSLLERLATRDDKLVLHVQTGSPNDRPETCGEPPLETRVPPRHYGYAAASVGATLAVSEVLQLFLGTRSLDLLFLFPVIAVAARLGLRPALLAVALSVICYNYFLLSPTFSFNPTAPQNLVMTGVLIVIAVYTGAMTTSMRGRLVLSDRSARENASIAALAQKLTRDADWETTALTICDHVNSLLKVQVVVLREVKGILETAAAIPSGVQFGPIDQAALDWAWAQGEEAGSGTEVLSSADWQFQPLKTSLGALAVLGISREDGRDPVRADQRLLLQTLVAQSALAHERLRLEDMMREPATAAPAIG